jgi:hypothetical protein
MIGLLDEAKSRGVSVTSDDLFESEQLVWNMARMACGTINFFDEHKILEDEEKQRLQQSTEAEVSRVAWPYVFFPAS